MKKIKLTIWNEFYHETHQEEIKKVYPEGMHKVIGKYIEEDSEIEVRYATMDQPEQGLPDSLLYDTDVLIWWGHTAHDKIKDELVQKMYERVVKEGMGMVFLHSGHESKIFKKFSGTESGRLKWREAGERERLWVIEPNHPIVAGVPECITLEHEEMYGERFDIARPDELIFISWFQGGEVFRSGFCYHRGHGRIFYFRPGHEEFPTYYNPHILRVIKNSVKWAAPIVDRPEVFYGNVLPSLEPL